MTSQSQRIVPMLPQQTVQPKNKEACTVAPLHPLEHWAKSSNPCGNCNKFYVVFTSIMVMADHDLGRDDGVLLGQRFCWSGLEVIGDYPKPTRCTLMCRNITTAGRDASGNVGPAGQTSNQARCAISSTGLLWQWSNTRFAVLGINKWSVIDTNTGAQGQQRRGDSLPMDFYQQIPGTMCMPNAGAVGPGHGLPPRWCSPLLLVGGREMIELARRNGPSLVMALPPLW